MSTSMSCACAAYYFARLLPSAVWFCFVSVLALHSRDHCLDTTAVPASPLADDRLSWSLPRLHRFGLILLLPPAWFNPALFGTFNFLPAFIFNCSAPVQLFISLHFHFGENLTTPALNLRVLVKWTYLFCASLGLTRQLSLCVSHQMYDI